MLNKRLVVALLAVVVLFLGIFSFAQSTDDENVETPGTVDNTDNNEKEGEKDEDPIISDETDEEEENIDEVTPVNNPGPTLMVLDTTAPVITLNGDGEIGLELGDEYTDEGATAVDAKDGEVDVTITGEVDTHVAGIYTLTYTATDAAGNEATATRTVIVSPIIEVPTSYADSIVIDTEDETGRTIIMQAGEVLTMPDVRAMISVDNYADVVDSISTDVPVGIGTYTITYNFEMNTENGTVQANPLVITVKVIDTTGPEVTFNPNGNTEWVKRVMGITVTAEDKGGDIVTAKSKWTNSKIAPNKSAFVTDLLSQYNSPNNRTGEWYLWVYLVDEYNNETMTSSAAYMIDTIAPVVSGVEDERLYNTDVSITVTEDNIDTITDNGTEITLNESNVYEFTTEEIHEIVVTDKAGNSASKTFTIDKTGPQITLNYADYSNHYRKAHARKANVTDALSGVNLDSLKYIWTKDRDISTDDLGFESFTTDMNLLTDVGVTGTYYLVVVATDNAGNETVLRTNGFYLDNTAPVINGVEDGNYYNENVTITVVEDNVEIITSNGTEITLDETNSYKFTTDGFYSVIVTDKAGNSVTKTFTVDKTSPVINGVENGNYYKEDVTITVVEDNIETITSNGTEITLDETNSYEFTAANTYVVIVTDKAGNSVTKTFAIDKTAPVINGVENGNYYKEDVTITVVEDNIETITSNGTEITLDETNSYKFTTDGFYSVIVTDKAGNSVTKTFTIDKTAPEIVATEISGQGGEMFIDNGKRVLLRFRTNEPLSNIDITLAGIEASVASEGNGVYRAVVYVSNVSPEGKVNFTITATDLAENQTVVTGDSINANYIIVDRTGPTVEFVENGNDVARPNQSTNVKLIDVYETLPGVGVDTSSLKYMWSTANEGIVETDFAESSSLSVDANNEGLVSTKNFDTGTYYLWILAKDNLGNTTIEVSDGFAIYNPINVTNLESITSRYHGYTFEFTLDDNLKVKDASLIRLELYNDGDLIARNTLTSGATQWNSIKEEDGLSSPFAPYGDFDYVADKYWQHNWYGSKETLPDSGKVIITINGVTYVKEVIVKDGDVYDVKPEVINVTNLESIASGYHGYTFEFTMLNGFKVKDASLIRLELYNSGNLIARNTLTSGATQWNSIKEEDGLSSPFAPYGDFDYVADKYWQHNWYGSKETLPDSGKVIITINGVTYVKEVTVKDGDVYDVKPEVINVTNLESIASGYHGYTFEFTMLNGFKVKDASLIRLELYNSGNLIARNTLTSGATQWNSIKEEDGLSSPFAPYGDFDYVADKYWQHNWYGSKETLPDSGKVIITINGVTYVKEVTVKDGDVYDVKPEVINVTNLESFASGYHGYTFEFTMLNGFKVKDASLIRLELYNSGNLIARNTLTSGATQWNSIKEEDGLSSPFAPYGDFDYVADKYWQHNWYGSKETLPDSGKVIITINGVTYVKEVTVKDGDVYAVKPEVLNITNLDPIESNYHGYSFEFTLLNGFKVKDASLIRLELFNSGNLIARNTLTSGATQWNSIKEEDGLSSPFAPYGDFDYVADKYWQHNWYGLKNSAIDRGDLIVTINGVTYTKSIDVNILPVSKPDEL